MCRYPIGCRRRYIKRTAALQDSFTFEYGRRVIIRFVFTMAELIAAVVYGAQAVPAVLSK